MKYRALCPHCGTRLPRRMALLNVPHVKRRCGICFKHIRAVAWAEYLSLILGAGLVVCLLLFLEQNFDLSWFARSFVLLFIFGFTTLIWPYFTIFEKVEQDARKDA